MNENTKKCPICPKECDLSDPHCGRGEEYAKTGKLPDQEHGKGEHGKGEHGPKRLRFENKEEQLVMKYLHHAVGVADRGGITQEQAGEMFSVLTTEETKKLAEMLEKISEHWMKMAPGKPHHHGRRHG